MANPVSPLPNEIEKESAELVEKLTVLAEEAALTGHGARAFLGLVGAAKSLPPARARRLREFFECFAHELGGIA